MMSKMSKFWAISGIVQKNNARFEYQRRINSMCAKLGPISFLGDLREKIFKRA